MANTLYRILPEFYADWGVCDDDEATVDMEQIIWLSGEWDTPVEELMEQVEEVKSTDEDDKDRLEMYLAGELDEMIALGWTDEEAKNLKELFFERIGKEYTDHLTEEDIWRVWKEVWERNIEPLLENSKEFAAEEVAEAIINSDTTAFEPDPTDSSKVLYYLHITDDGEIVSSYYEADESFTAEADIEEWADDLDTSRFYEEFETLKNEQFMDVCRRLADKATDYIKENIRRRGE